MKFRIIKDGNEQFQVQAYVNGEFWQTEDTVDTEQAAFASLSEEIQYYKRIKKSDEIVSILTEVDVDV